jgi:hypothetical protein
MGETFILWCSDLPAGFLLAALRGVAVESFAISVLTRR